MNYDSKDNYFQGRPADMPNQMQFDEMMQSLAEVLEFYNNTSYKIINLSYI